MSIKKGDKIKVDYTGTLEDGKVFDTTQHKDHAHPLEFEVGSGQLIKGFDEAVVGMKVGEEKEINLEPKDAYGDADPARVQKIPRDKLPKEPKPKEGMVLVMKTPDGNQFPVKIAAVEGDEVSLDMNHPLAGKKLTFKIKIVEVN